MNLTSEQVNLISRVIDEGRITIDTLRDDILDHLCCSVEIGMSRGKPFEQAFGEALLELAPNGLNALQQETIFLLNSTNINRMKKLMYAVGLLSAMVFVTGWLFSILHLPGATILQFCGFLSFAFIFLPLLTFDYFKLNVRRALSDKLKVILGLASGVVVALSAIFKVLHLEGTNLLLLLGTAIFVFGFLPTLFFTLYKKSV
jgi:hypothetical protein